MGYTTNYQGQIKFKEDLTSSQLAYLSKFLGKDVRSINMNGDEIKGSARWLGQEHVDSIYCKINPSFYYIEYKILDDFSGLEWTEMEKQNELDEVLQFLIDRMKEKYSKFEVEGVLMAQGEEFDDRWKLSVNGDKVKRTEIKIKGQKVTCPHCEENFIIEE